MRSKSEGRLLSWGVHLALQIAKNFCLPQLWHRMGGPLNQAMVTKEARGRDATGTPLIPI